jgi:hypothetical protein
MGYNNLDETGHFGSVGFSTCAIETLRVMLERLNRPKLYLGLTAFIENGVSYGPILLAREAMNLRKSKETDKNEKDVLSYLARDARRAKGFIALTV